MESSARRGRAVELEERADPLARLGRDLRRLERGAERGDHVELAPAGDLGARARGRSRAARPAGARARARPRRRRRGRRAAAARRAGRAPRRAGRTPPRPTSRYGTARSSNATATAWPSPRTERTSTQTSSGATSSRATSRSTSAATACACARSVAQRQNATSPPGRARGCSAFSSRSVDRLDHRARGGAGSRSPAAVATPPAARPSPPATRPGSRAMFLVAAPRKRWIAWSSSPDRGDVAVLGRPAAAAAGPGRSSCPAARRRARAR